MRIVCRCLSSPGSSSGNPLRYTYLSCFFMSLFVGHVFGEHEKQFFFFMPENAFFLGFGSARNEQLLSSLASVFLAGLSCLRCVVPAPKAFFWSVGFFSPAMRPNMACSRRVGVCAIYEHFSDFEFFLLPSRVHARPHAANACPLGAFLQNKN